MRLNKKLQNFKTKKMDKNPDRVEKEKGGKVARIRRQRARTDKTSEIREKNSTILDGKRAAK